MRPADQIETILRSATTTLDRERTRCAEATREAAAGWRQPVHPDDLDEDDRDDDASDGDTDQASRRR